MRCALEKTHLSNIGYHICSNGADSDAIKKLANEKHSFGSGMELNANTNKSKYNGN